MPKNRYGHPVGEDGQPLTFGEIYGKFDPELMDTQVPSGAPSDGRDAYTTYADDREMKPLTNAERSRRWKAKNHYPRNRTGRALWGIQQVTKGAEKELKKIDKQKKVREMGELLDSFLGDDDEQQ